MRLRRIAAAVAVGLVLASGGMWALAGPPREGFAPDPAVHPSDKQWVFEIAWSNGVSAIEKARAVTVKTPQATPRVMGRFALEFWVGRELLDRVRFDVPLLGDEREVDPKRLLKKPKFDKVTTKVKAQMADHPRATMLAFVDRSTGETRKYFWPPDENGKLTPFSAKAATAAVDGGITLDGGPVGDAGFSGALSSRADGGANDGGANDGGDAGSAGDAGDAGDSGSTPLRDAAADAR